MVNKFKTNIVRWNGFCKKLHCYIVGMVLSEYTKLTFSKVRHILPNSSTMTAVFSVYNEMTDVHINGSMTCKWLNKGLDAAV